MSGEPIITLVGNLTDDPELRFTPSGAAVANFTVAQTPRVKNGDEWEDGTPMFVRCAVWREAAENVAESLQRGMRVVVLGRLTQRNYEHNGEKRTSLELAVDEVGPALRYATARVTRATRGGGNGGGQRQQAQQADPWASSSSQQQADPWARPGADEPPF